MECIHCGGSMKRIEGGRWSAYGSVVCEMIDTGHASGLEWSTPRPVLAAPPAALEYFPPGLTNDQLAELSRQRREALIEKANTNALAINLAAKLKRMNKAKAGVMPEAQPVRVVEVKGEAKLVKLRPVDLPPEVTAAQRREQYVAENGEPVPRPPGKRAVEESRKVQERARLQYIREHAPQVVDIPPGTVGEAMVRIRLQVYARDCFACVFCDWTPPGITIPEMIGRLNDYVPLPQELHRINKGVPIYRLMTLDHIQPQTFGGRTVLENLQTACSVCNGRKGHKWVEGHVPEYVTAAKRREQALEQELSSVLGVMERREARHVLKMTGS